MKKLSLPLLVGAVILGLGSLANAETASEQRLNEAKAKFLEIQVKLARDCASEYSYKPGDIGYNEEAAAAHPIMRANACEALRALTKGEAKDK